MRQVRSMDKRRKHITALFMASVMAVTLLPSGTVIAGPEGNTGIESYSKGAPYEFSPDKGAVEQLEDLFTTIDLQEASISDLQREMEKGNLTSEMLTEMYLSRIEAYDRREDLNSIIRINENALDDARKLDEERAAGKIRGKMHGIPIVVKDNYNVAGMPTAAGSVALADFYVSEDAGAVKKLKEAGAVIIARANLSEFAYSAVDSHSTLGGEAHNAYDTKRSAAGSSGGTATAVRSNFAAAGLGTDTGGSIRNPANWSNLFGIRPSKGLTSIEGVIPLAASRDTTGPMAKTAEDLAIVLEAMAGTDEGDDFTIEADADALLGDGYSTDLPVGSLKGKRIGYLRSSFDYSSLSVDRLNDLCVDLFGVRDGFTEEDRLPAYKLATETNSLVMRARADLRKAGAEFVDLSDEPFMSDEELFLYRYLNTGRTTEYDINSYLNKYAGDNKIKTVNDILKTGTDIGYIGDYLQHNFNENHPPVETFNRDDYGNYGYIEYGKGKYLRSRSWEKTLEIRKAVSRVMEENDVDAIMYLHFETPSPIQNTYDYWESSSEYDRTFGPALGLPDMNMPIGFLSADLKGGDNKLPVGLALVGRFGGERELFEIANVYEKCAGDMTDRSPENTPALRDERLNSYLDALMEKACDIDPNRYGGENTSKIRKLNDAYKKALDADYSDPYSVYGAAYELAVAYDKLIDTDREKRKAAGTVLVKGQKIKDISSSMFSGVEGITHYASDDKKIASVTKKGQLKGKNPGKTVIKAIDAKDKKNKVTLSSCTVTVLDKPELQFEDSYSSAELPQVISGYGALVSSDPELLNADKWISSKSEVAEVDPESGKITIKGKGKTKITAFFGNVKVKGTIKVE